MAAQRGELKRALEFYAEAAHTAEAAHVHYFLALAHNNFAYHSLLLGQLEAAQRALTKGKQLAEMALLHAQTLHDGHTLLAEARKILAAHGARAELDVLMVALKH